MVGVGTYGNGGKLYLTKLLEFRLKGKWRSSCASLLQNGGWITAMKEFLVLLVFLFMY